MITDLGTRLVSYPFIHKRKTTATTLRIVRLLGRWTREHCGGNRSMRKNQDPSLWMFYYFYIYVICRSSLCEWKITIGKVVVSMRKKCLKRPYLSCLYLLHNFVLHIRRYIYSSKSHLHEETEAFDDALLKFIHALRRSLHQTRQCKCMRMNRDPSLCIIRNYACFY